MCQTSDSNLRQTTYQQEKCGLNVIDRHARLMKTAPADDILSLALLIWLNLSTARKLDMLNEISKAKSEVCLRLYLNPPDYWSEYILHATHTHTSVTFRSFPCPLFLEQDSKAQIDKFFCCLNTRAAVY